MEDEIQMPYYVHIIPNSQCFHYLCTSGNSRGTLGWSNCSKRCSRLSYLAICLYFFVCMLLSARKSNTDIPWYKMTNNCLGGNVWVGPNLVVISYKDEWNLPTRSTTFFSEIEIATCWCVYCAKSINTPSSWELHLSIRRRCHNEWELLQSRNGSLLKEQHST